LGRVKREELDRWFSEKMYNDVERVLNFWVPQGKLK
jgi:hypothetical protein